MGMLLKYNFMDTTGPFLGRFQRTVLDLTQQWRFANLPNNAKLEVVPRTRTQTVSDSQVSYKALWAIFSHLCADPLLCDWTRHFSSMLILPFRHLIHTPMVHKLERNTETPKCMILWQLRRASNHGNIALSWDLWLYLKSMTKFKCVMDQL